MNRNIPKRNKICSTKEFVIFELTIQNNQTIEQPN